MASRIQHAAARDDQRTLRLGEQVEGAGEFVGIGGGASDAVGLGAEEAFRIVVGFGLDILRHAQGHGAAVHRIGQHLDRAGRRGQKLFRTGDAVPPAGNGAETVIDADGGVVEVLDLLKHRIGTAAGEDIAGQEQHRQPVDVRHAGGGDHIGGARPDRGGAGHHLAAVPGLGEGDGRQRHALLVMGAEGGQRFAGVVQRLAQSRHVAVAEDAPAAGEQRYFRTVDIRALGGKVPDHRLGGCQPDRLFHRIFLHRFLCHLERRCWAMAHHRRSARISR